MKQLGMGLVVVGLVACSKSEPPGGAAPIASSSAQPVVSAAPESAPPAASPEVAPVAATSEAPASFKDGAKEPISGAVGLGCEATSSKGWLQFLCRKKNGTGGRPVRALIRGAGAAPAEPAANAESQPDGGEPGEERLANEQGELVIVVPYAGDAKTDVEIEWTDTRYTLHVTGASATLEWAASGVPHRRACQKLLDESRGVIAAAQKLEGEARLTGAEVGRLPRFGVCQPAGLGSWAVGLKALSGKGEGAARALHFELEVVRVSLEGTRQAAPFATLEVAPGGFELAALQVYDFDDDGRNELIVPYELKAPAGTPPVHPAPIWSFSDAGVAAYAKAPAVNGGIGVEHLDFDMRPDFGTYGGFVAWLGSDCGLKSCPARVTGPKLFWHGLPDGGFSDADEPARSALKRSSCQKPPAQVVVAPGGALNVAQTAKNLVCARAYGTGKEALAEELAKHQAALCGEAATCPLRSALEGWLELPLPVALTQTVAKK